jgi:Glycosyl hydrolase family 9/Secretion system C-terminal sorting domain/Cellulose binding domain
MKTNKLKKYILLFFILIATITTQVNAQTTTFTNAQYAEVLQKSIFFYEAQQSGTLPAFNRVSWRSNSGLNDGKDVGKDLTGGWYDAGDHIKFGLPMAYSATVLSWSAIDYKDGYIKSGQYTAIRNNLKFVYDYFIKCHTAPNEFYAQVGDGGADHSFWGAPEILPVTMNRPSVKIDATHPGTEVVMETAAALAAGSMLFADDATYSALLLKHAKELYTLGNTNRGKYDATITGASGFYTSFSGYQDELTWGNIWLYRATNDMTYLTNAETEFNNISNEPQTSFKPYKDSFSWDDKSYGCYPLLAKLTGKQKYYDAAEKNLDFWTTGTGTGNTERITYSPGGQAYVRQWGSLRYASNMAFLALNYCDLTNASATKKVTYKNFALKQINYALGDNPNKRSYVCGFGVNPPVNPHHRGAHGGWTNSLQSPVNSRHILYGALVGGPKASDDAYIDDRTDYTANEVATDYNAGFTGAVAAIMSTQTAFTPPAIPKETVGEEYVISAKSVEATSTIFVTSLKVQNHTAWPARKPAKLSFRYFIDISEAISAGYSISNYSAVSYFGEGNPTLSSFKLWKGTIYYLEVEYINDVPYPGGQSESRREFQLRITGPANSAWNNDFSNVGMTSAEALTQYVPVYENGVKVYGTEPAGGSLAAEDFDIVASQLGAYPNPASNVLKINLPTSVQIKQIALIDVSGKVVLKKSIENNSANYNLDISTIPSGMYLVNFKSDDNAWSKKIIKQ